MKTSWGLLWLTLIFVSLAFGQNMASSDATFIGGPIAVSAGATAKTEVPVDTQNGFSVSVWSESPNLTAAVSGPAGNITQTGEGHDGSSEMFFSAGPGSSPGSYTISVTNNGDAAKFSYMLNQASETVMSVVSFRDTVPLWGVVAADAFLYNAGSSTVSAKCVKDSWVFDATVEQKSDIQFSLECPANVVGDVLMVVQASGITNSGNAYKRLGVTSVHVSDHAPLIQITDSKPYQYGNKLAGIAVALHLSRTQETDSSLVFTVSAEGQDEVLVSRTDFKFTSGSLDGFVVISYTDLWPFLDRLGGVVNLKIVKLELQDTGEASAAADVPQSFSLGMYSKEQFYAP